MWNCPAVAWADTTQGESLEEALGALAGAGQLALVAEARLPMQELVHCRLYCPTCGAVHVDEGEHAGFNHAVHGCMTCHGRFQSPVPYVGVPETPRVPVRVSREWGPSR